MAGLTLFGRGQSHVVAAVETQRANTVVAIHAAIRDERMIDRGADPSRGRMALVAGVRR